VFVWKFREATGVKKHPNINSSGVDFDGQNARDHPRGMIGHERMENKRKRYKEIMKPAIKTEIQDMK